MTAEQKQMVSGSDVVDMLVNTGAEGDGAFFPERAAQDARATRKNMYGASKDAEWFHEKIEHYEDVEQIQEESRSKVKMVFAARM